MSVVLALASAVLFGGGDFFGGIAARRTAATAVITHSQLVGLCVLLPALLVVPSRFQIASVTWGCGAGLAGGVALLLFYRSLALGSMSVAAPLTALGSAGVPVLIGLAVGERTSATALAGIAVAVVAAVLIGADGGRLPRPHDLLGNRATTGALASGVLFGLFFVFLSRSSSVSGLWPLAGARVTSISLMVAVGLLGHRALRPARAALVPTVVAGLADMGANVLFLLATRLGLLIITAVLIALYPAITVVLARMRLGEKASWLQVGGFGAAAVAVTCIAIG